MIRSDRLTWLVCVLLLVALAAPAQAARCSAPKEKAKVQLRMLYAEPGFVQDRNAAGMRNIINDIQGYTSGPWHLPLGLTIADFNMTYQTQMNFRRAKGGGYCVSLSAARITIGYEDMTIFVSRDYPEGSCQFNAILDHELEHVAINEAVLRAYKPRFQKALQRVLRAKTAIFVHRKGEARSAYILELKRQLEPVADAMLRERTQKNGRIDTRESYARIQSQCDSW